MVEKFTIESLRLWIDFKINSLRLNFNQVKLFFQYPYQSINKKLSLKTGLI
jgi:hypothetical protein